jgi:hypothetical protein
MTFTFHSSLFVSFLTPLSLLLGLLAVPILILYMLKLRRKEVEVSSVMLWQLLLRDREANAPWQRLKRNLLLFLQLLLLALLVLALARPFLNVKTVATGTVVVVLDASASMNATDVAPSRFEAARLAVRQLINDLAADGTMALILAGHQPEVLASATGDKVLLREALSKAQVETAPADWEAALALASGTVRAVSQEQSTIVIISDGGLPENLPPLPGEVRYVPIGASSDNLALSALALRPTASGPQLFAAVSNHGDAARTVIVSISIAGQLFSAQQLIVPAGQSASFVLSDLPKAPAVYEAKLSLPATSTETQVDALTVDDTAWAVYQPPSSGRVLLVSPGNTFLEQMLTALPGLQPFRKLPNTPFPTDPFDLYVFDGIISDTLPTNTELFLINPSTNALFTVGEVFTNTALKRIAENDPLTAFVDWRNVHILQAKKVDVPPWARVLIEAEGGPLAFAGEVGGRRVVVLTFKLQESDLPLLVTYPILMSNLMAYLAPAQAFSAPNGLHPGDTLTIKPAGGDRVLAIDNPNGTRYSATATEAGVIFADTHTLGLYTVLSNQSVLGTFAVNLFNPSESAIRPAPIIRLGRAEVTAAVRDELGQYEIWPWLAALAFALLLIEWWVYHRGATLPAGPGWRGVFQRKKVAP